MCGLWLWPTPPSRGRPSPPGSGFIRGGEGERVSAGEMDGGMASDRGVKKGKEREIV